MKAEKRGYLEMDRMKTILVTGAAGFIGSNLCLKLFEKSENVHIIGIDNMNAYYDVNIKKWRLSEINREYSGSR